MTTNSSTVSNFLAEKHSRKAVYQSVKDFRFKVYTCIFDMLHGWLTLVVKPKFT